MLSGNIVSDEKKRDRIAMVDHDRTAPSDTRSMIEMRELNNISVTMCNYLSFQYFI